MDSQGKLQGLSWLVDEVETSLHESSEELEVFLSDTTEDAPIRRCLALIHQVHGSLQMVECHGPLLLVGEMELVTQRMVERRLMSVVDAGTVLVQAVITLPGYLRQLLTSRRDQPETLLLLLNELRAVQGEPLVSESAFFTPNLLAARQVSKTYDRQPDPVAMTNLLRKLRQMYQYALLGVVRGEKTEESFSYLDKVFSRLRELSKGMPREPLWNVVLALLEGVAAKDIVLGQAVQMLLRQLEVEIRRLSQAGYDGLMQPMPEALLKNLLFYIAHGKSEGPRAVQVRKQFELDQALPDVLMEETGDGLSPLYQPDAAKAMVTVLDEEFLSLKDALSRLVEDPTDYSALMAETDERLKRIVDSLAMLGRHEQRQQLDEARALWSAFRQQPEERAGLLAMADKLVLAENGLHGWLELNRQLIEGVTISKEMQVEVNRAQAVLLEEAQAGLAKIKDVIVDFIASRWQRDKLGDVPQLLSEVRGALQVLEQHRAAKVLMSCQRYLKEEVMSEHSVPNWNMLDALAESLTSIEYYLDVIDQRDSDSEEMILSLAEQGVAKLGYPVTALDQPQASAPSIPTLQSDMSAEQVSSTDGEPLANKEPSAEQEPSAEIEPSAEQEPSAYHELSVEHELPSEQAPLEGEQPETLEPAFEFDQAYESGLDPALQAVADTTPGAVDEMPAAIAQEPSLQQAAEVTGQVPLDDEEERADDEIVEVFLEEVDEVVALLNENYQLWVAQTDNPEPMTEIRRAFHTLKGGSRMVGAQTLGELAWSLENLLNRTLENRVTITPTLIALVELGCEVVPEVAAAFREYRQPQRAEYIGQLIIAAEALAKGEETALPESAVSVDAEESQSDAVTEDLVPLPESPVLAEDDEERELLIIFAEEAAQHLATVSQFVAEQRQAAPVFTPPNSSVQSALHTLKGSARMAGVESIGDLAAPLEHFIKELYTYQLNVDDDTLGLLDDAVTYCRLSLSTVPSTGHVEDIPELTVFLERLAELRDRAMATVLGSEPNTTPHQVSPDLLNLLMTEGMQPLLDAEEGIQQWQQVHDDAPLRLFRDDLGQLVEAAERAGVPEMRQLAQLLGDAYTQIIDSQRRPDSELVVTLLDAHHSLLAMIDAVAANQDLSPCPEPLQQALLDIAAMAGVAQTDDTGGEEGSAPDQPEAEQVPEETQSAVEEFHVEALNRDDIDLDILEIFIGEADELLEEIDRGLQQWAQNWQDQASIESLKRSLHTFKGGARMAGLQQLGQLSHDFETEITTLESHPENLSEDVFRGLLHRQDYLLAALTVARELFNGGEPAQPPREAVTEVPLEPVQAVIEPEPIEAPPAAAEEQPAAPVEEVLLPEIVEPVVPQQQRQLVGQQDTIKVSAPLLESLVNLVGETSISRGRAEQQVSDFAYTLDEMQSTIARLKDQVRRIGMETEAHMMFRQEQLEAMDSPEGFDPLEMDRYSHLQQLSQSLLESTYDLQDLKETLGDKAKGAESHLLAQSRINSDLQERLMRMRLVPFTRIVPRLRRIVRQVGDELGKKVDLKLVNIDGEMDRSVMEQMLAPLEHMIRNAIDHGMESNADRLAAGKPEVGTISVGMVREGGDILLQLSDDGRGLNTEAIRQRAIERELIPADNNLEDQDIIQFIFEPGFSTAEKVSQVSGRGVGMDVVNSQVRELGGTIQTLSKQGQGTEFIIRLPFTVSVNRALMIEMDSEIYALPLSSVDGVVRISPKELEYYYRNPDARLEYAGEHYEVRYLGSLLRDDAAPRIDTSQQSVFLVLVHSETRHYAVQVDDLAGNAEIVSKSLGAPFSKVPGLSGATLMSDGRVVVILDLLGLLRAQVVARAGVEVHDSQQEREQSSTLSVMVVDDSVTVRKVTSRFLEREGYEVVTARDGVEAMKLLEDYCPDVMLLDIEMPRMDGFEVAKRVKGSVKLRAIPIIMITSRTGEKHRERALALGVERYMGKPYQEDELLTAMGEVMQLADQQ